MSQLQLAVLEACSAATSAWLLLIDASCTAKMGLLQLEPLQANGAAAMQGQVYLR
jgi:hypothetical protein